MAPALALPAAQRDDVDFVGRWTNGPKNMNVAGGVDCWHQSHLVTENHDRTVTSAGLVVGSRLGLEGRRVVLEELLLPAVEDGRLQGRRKRIDFDPYTVQDWPLGLKEAGVVDIPTWPRIQSLSDLRNLCAHHKEREPTSEESPDLIEGSAKVTKSVPERPEVARKRASPPALDNQHRILREM